MGVRKPPKGKPMKKLTKKELENKYGGFAAAAGGSPMGAGGWAMVISMVAQTVLTAIMSFKSISSDEGSLKYKGVETKWKNHDDSKNSKDSKSSSGSGSSAPSVYIF